MACKLSVKLAEKKKSNQISSYLSSCGFSLPSFKQRYQYDLKKNVD